MTIKLFRSTDEFRMNEEGNRDYVPYKFISGLNVLGYYYQEEHDIHNYLLYLDKNSKHIPERLLEYVSTYNCLYLWNIEDDYWAVESEEQKNLMAFFVRKKARLFLPYYTSESYEDYLVEWAYNNNKWDEYRKLMERWQSGNACDC